MIVIKNKIKLVLLTSFVLVVTTGFSQSAKFKVVLDAGHGGKDFGAVYNGHIEKNIALDVVLKTGKILEKNPNIEVIYTRKSDVFVELDERARIANKEDATIFVSIHCNANKASSGEGFETYVMGVARNKSNLEVAKLENDVVTLEKDYKQNYEGYNPNSPELAIGIMMQQEEYIENSIALASNIQDNFATNKSRKNRGVRQAGFLVLRKISMPRILVEMGFISNPREGAFLGSEDGQEEVANHIATAIASYKKEYYGSNNNDTTIEKPKPKPEKIVEVEAPKTAENVATTTESSQTETPKTTTAGIVFKIQIAASATKMDLKPKNFKGLNHIEMSTDNGKFFKYSYGNTSSFETAQENLAQAKAKGYESAYIVAFKDGKKINLKDAIKK